MTNNFHFNSFSDKNRDTNTKYRRRTGDLKRSISSNNTLNHNNNRSNNNNNNNSYEEDDAVNVQIKSRVVSKETAIQRREEIIAMQSRNNDLGRDKRIFSSLLGTLQKFKKEESVLKSKEEKKAQIERKVEEQEMQEKIKLKQQRDELIESKKKKLFEVKALETKMEKWKDLETWENSTRHQVNFIKTSTKPEIFWRPKIFDDTTTELKAKTEQDVNEKIAERKLQVEEELKAIEDQADIENHFTSDGHVKKESSIDSHNENGKGIAVKDENCERGKKMLNLIKIFLINMINYIGIKRRASSSPEINTKRMLSQVVIKCRD